MLAVESCALVGLLLCGLVVVAGCIGSVGARLAHRALSAPADRAEWKVAAAQLRVAGRRSQCCEGVVRCDLRGSAGDRTGQRRGSHNSATM